MRLRFSPETTAQAQGMKGSNSKQNKSLNLRLLLSEIATQGPLSRADLARATSLTKQTITNLIDELVRHQLVIEVGQLKQGVGKPSTLLTLNSGSLMCLALRLWPDRLELAVSDLSGQFIGMHSASLQATQAVAPQVQAQLAVLLQQLSLQPAQLLAAGFSQISTQTDPLLRHQQQQLMQQQLAGVLQLPVCGAHTAAACAAYQLLHGEARQLQSFCYIHLGQQIDCALVFNRQLLSGQHGLSGALGDIFVTPDQDHSNGDFGRLNDFASLQSLQRFVEKKWPGLQLENPAAFDIMAQQSARLSPWLELTTEPLRVAIHTLESMFNCQTIIIGGDLSTWLLDLLISRLRPLIPSIAQHGSRDVPRLIKTPDVERIALKGLASLPLEQATRTGVATDIALPEHLQLDARQQLLFAPELASDSE